ncbi:unnamed protein product [Symbiodinium pilosum]|uniref:D-lactate dehydrogenase n=1 Tax=Symbiodinium pilosum TaxID=2952 RepID=A0A812JI38_SYMPI|nr:unnamed protein product [Symbiodinium pilosum]
MAQTIIAQCAAVDKQGLGTISHELLAKALHAALPDAWHDDEIESLLHPWGEVVEYKDFVSWLFRDRSPVRALRKRSSFKVAIFSCAPYDRDWFDRTNEELGCNFEFEYHSEQLNIDTVTRAKGCSAVCTFVNDFAGEDVVKALAEEGVKLIALRCAGFDRVDLRAAKDAGLTVSRVPAYSPYAVGEHAVALMLSLNRRIPNAYRNSRLGNFKLDGQLGCDMYKKRVGIIGTGLIGTIAATVLKKGFECDVVAYDVFPNPKISDPAPDGLGIPYLDLDTVLATSDFISLHAPLLPTTKHMINAEKLKIMKKGIQIVNTSRGGLIDTTALIQGLKDGTIAGAAMDVVEGEAPYFFRDFSTSCVTDDNIATLVRMPNVILTPHLAFFTQEALKTISDTTLKSMQGIREGTGPPKQNGVLDTVCLPPEAPKEDKGGYAASRNKERSQRMAFMKELPAPGPELKEKVLPALENAHSRPFRVAFYSAMPHDKEVFENMNEEFDANITFQFYKAALCSDSVVLAQGADAVCVFVHDDCSAEILATLKDFGVKMVALRCGGFNNVDVEKAEELGLVITRVPAYSAFGSGEHAVALATSVNRSIPQAAEGTRRANFTLNGLQGFDMVGKKVGIIGTGRTGCVVARIFKNGYRCEVMAHDIEEKGLVRDPPPAGLGIPYVSLDELFRTSDIICLHVPLLQETVKLINAESIAKMKPGVILVNVSRGGLVDTRALIDGLRKGIIGGAGLDVVAEEWRCATPSLGAQFR